MRSLVRERANDSDATGNALSALEGGAGFNNSLKNHQSSRRSKVPRKISPLILTLPNVLVTARFFNARAAIPFANFASIQR
jgi:hypothetical protein